MTPSRSPKNPPPWSVPVARDDIAPTGQHFDLAADEGTRAALARMAAVSELPRLAASFDVTRHGGSGLRVTGRVWATVGQACVVTLEPLVNEIEEEVDLIFMPGAAGAEPASAKSEVQEGPEPLIDERVDLGAIATEFFMLGLDPYPRKAGVAFESPQSEEADAGPFAALAALKSGTDRGRG
jgi:hypothetical protein